MDLPNAPAQLSGARASFFKVMHRAPSLLIPDWIGNPLATISQRSISTTDQKVPLQADRGGEHSDAEDMTARTNGGDSGGGTYPNPHTGKSQKTAFWATAGRLK